MSRVVYDTGMYIIRSLFACIFSVYACIFSVGLNHCNPSMPGDHFCSPQVKFFEPNEASIFIGTFAICATSCSHLYIVYGTHQDSKQSDRKTYIFWGYIQLLSVHSCWSRKFQLIQLIIVSIFFLLNLMMLLFNQLFFGIIGFWSFLVLLSYSTRGNLLERGLSK